MVAAKLNLPDGSLNSDQAGCWLRVRFHHCTLVKLTSAIVPNVNNSAVQFLTRGKCVRAVPSQYNILIIFSYFYYYLAIATTIFYLRHFVFRLTFLFINNFYWLFLVYLFYILNDFYFLSQLLHMVNIEMFYQILLNMIYTLYVSILCYT